MSPELIVQITEALIEGTRDANTLAQEFSVSASDVYTIRSLETARRKLTGEPPLPTPPPTSRVYQSRPLTESEQDMRKLFAVDPDVTVAQLAAKYGTNYHHCYRVLDRAPSLIAARAQGTTDQDKELIEKIRPYLAAAKLNRRQIAVAVGHPNWVEFVNWMANHPKLKAEYKSYVRRFGYRVEFQNDPTPPITEAEYLADWDRTGMQPFYRDGKLVTK